MIAEDVHPKTTSSSPAQTDEPVQEVRRCLSHQKLNAWQIEQYRRAIDENMWYMGERLGRAVSWEEAEYDFLHNGYYGCAPKWRMEFCSHHCSHFPNCKLGQLFVRK
ncbi:MAG: hypothetical protein GXY61_12220 [Lentisphaerae bacterium]|nr:hypothetical protein [Lentisphaerota bacterium]